jgi:hypothetical protein
MLKNIGLICEGCGGGHHEYCDLEVERRDGTKSKHMCVCFYSTHPYLSRDQLEPSERRISAPVSPATGVEPNREVERLLHPGRDKAQGVSSAVR